MEEKLSVEEELGLDANALAITRAILFDRRYDSIKEEGDRIYSEVLEVLEKHIGDCSIGGFMYAMAKTVATVAMSASKSSQNVPNPLVVVRAICYLAEVFSLFGDFRTRKVKK